MIGQRPESWDYFGVEFPVTTSNRWFPVSLSLQWNWRRLDGVLVTSLGILPKIKNGSHKKPTKGCSHQLSMNWHCYVPSVFRRGEESSELSLAGCGKTPVAERGHFASPWRSMEDPRLTSHCRCVGRKTSAKATDEILQKAVKVCSVCKKPWKKTREKKDLASNFNQKKHRTLLYPAKNRHQQKIGFLWEIPFSKLAFFSEGWICNKHHPPMPSRSRLESRFTWKWSCGRKKSGRQPKPDNLES